LTLGSLRGLIRTIARIIVLAAFALALLHPMPMAGINHRLHL
jgi:hypothetical protein